MELNVLLLCNKPAVGKDANTIIDHIEAFENYSKHRIWLCSNIGELPEKLILDKFDALVIHYSIFMLSDWYLAPKARESIKKYKGLKVAFIQDEYRQINDMISMLNYLKIDLLFSCFPDQELDNIYPPEKLKNLKKVNKLTGYIPERLTQLKKQIPISERHIHVGYRGRKLPFWYGELAYEKWNIVDKWKFSTKSHSIISDVSYNEKDRFYGEDWLNFLTSCKTTLGVESGASIMDFTGKLQEKIETYQALYPNDSFHFVQRKFLKEYEGKHYLNQISPRCFEAIALKTVLILYEGEYSGILQADRHYIMLKKDYSNIESVLDRLKDDRYLQNMADTAFDEIVQNEKHSYKDFINKVDNIISKEFCARKKLKRTDPYNESLYYQHMNYVHQELQKQKKRLPNVSMYISEIKNKIRQLISYFICVCCLFIVSPRHALKLSKRKIINIFNILTPKIK